MDLGRHPSQKTRAHGYKNRIKGMAPITKNILVVDEYGNEYEATYLKRAKGLVKNGRARFAGENKICLACPPDNTLEDNIMSSNSNINDTDTATTIPVLSMEFILSRIDQILKDNAHTHEAIKAVQDIPVMKPNENMVNYQGDFAGQAKAEAISKAVLSRETTNQQLIRLLEKMYDDLKPKKQSESVMMFQQLTETLRDYPPDTVNGILQAAVTQMF